MDLFGFNDPLSKATFKNNVVLNTIIVASLGCTILSAIFYSTENWIDLSVTLGALTLLGTAFFLYWSGRVNAAIKIKLFGAYALMWAGVFSQGGINDAGFQILYPIFIFTVALTPLFVHRVMGTLTVLLLFLLMYLEQTGFFLTRQDPNSGLVEGLVILNVLVILYFTTQFFVGRLRETQLNLIKAKDDLEKLIQEKNAFLSMLTHDMKTPLTTIGLYAELLSKNPQLAAQNPRISQSITSSQRALLHLVNDVLEVEQLQLGNQIEIEREQINIPTLLEEWVQGLEEIASNKECYLTFNSSIDDAMITGDQARLQRAFSNLATNAIKYSPSGSNIDVLLEPAGENQIALTVKDNGYGIPREELPYIFDFYRRVEANSDKADGTGVGLAIVKAIVEAHDGNIEVESQENLGSTFIVRLPQGFSKVAISG